MNKLKDIKEGLTFDDVLLIPGKSDFSKEQTDISTKLNKNIKLNIPIIAAPMDKVCENEMAISLAQNGALGVIHRNQSIEKQIKQVNKVKNSKIQNSNIASIDKNNKLLVGAATGPTGDFEKRVNALIKANINIIVIDTAQGYSTLLPKAIAYIKTNFPEIIVMAGNVATYDGAKFLIEAGADILRVGMGPGSICSTRIVTGMGVPQLTAVMEAVKAVKDTGTNVAVIADGGIKQTGDMAKALGMGANAVMVGSLLSGYDQSPGEIVEVKGKNYKIYRGMGSSSAVSEGSERYGQKNIKDKSQIISEGIEGLVKYKGNVEKFLYQVKGSLKSSFFYIGGRNLKRFQEKAQFMRVTGAGMKESHPHSIAITETGGNYSLAK